MPNVEFQAPYLTFEDRAQNVVIVGLTALLRTLSNIAQEIRRARAANRACRAPVPRPNQQSIHPKRHSNALKHGPERRARMGRQVKGYINQVWETLD